MVCYLNAEVMLTAWLVEVEAGFLISQVLPIVASLLTFPFHAMVRMAAVSGITTYYKLNQGSYVYFNYF